MNSPHCPACKARQYRTLSLTGFQKLSITLYSALCCRHHRPRICVLRILHDLFCCDGGCTPHGKSMGNGGNLGAKQGRVEMGAYHLMLMTCIYLRCGLDAPKQGTKTWVKNNAGSVSPRPACHNLMTAHRSHFQPCQRSLHTCRWSSRAACPRQLGSVSGSQADIIIGLQWDVPSFPSHPCLQCPASAHISNVGPSKDFSPSQNFTHYKMWPDNSPWPLFFQSPPPSGLCFHPISHSDPSQDSMSP